MKIREDEMLRASVGVFVCMCVCVHEGLLVHERRPMSSSVCVRVNNVYVRGCVGVSDGRILCVCVCMRVGA